MYHNSYDECNAAISNHCNKLGGEGVSGVYGTLTLASLEPILEFVLSGPGNLVVGDGGSGIGRPLLHAAAHHFFKNGGVPPPPLCLYGIENDKVKNHKALSVLEAICGTHPGLVRPKIILADLTRVATLNPLTRIVLAWEGFPYGDMCAIGALVKKSTIRKIVIVEKSMRNSDPVKNMADMGFGRVTLECSFRVKMSGSRRQLVAYCFVRADDEGHVEEVHPDLDEIDSYVPEVARVLRKK